MQATITKKGNYESIQHNVLSGANMAAQFIHCNIDYEALELELETRYTYTHMSYTHSDTLTRGRVPEVSFTLGVRVVKPRPLEPKRCVGANTAYTCY